VFGGGARGATVGERRQDVRSRGARAAGTGRRVPTDQRAQARSL